MGDIEEGIKKEREEKIRSKHCDIRFLSKVVGPPGKLCSEVRL